MYGYAVHIVMIIGKFRHKGLKALYEEDNAQDVPASSAAKIKRILAALEFADNLTQMATMPGWKLDFFGNSAHGEANARRDSPQKLERTLKYVSFEDGSNEADARRSRVPEEVYYIRLKATAKASTALPSRVIGVSHSASTAIRLRIWTLKIIIERNEDMPMKNPPHPGEIIREDIIAALGLTLTRAAAILGIRRATLSDVTRGKASLSPEMALRLEKAFGVSMDLLLKMQAGYDASQARRLSGKIKVKRWHASDEARM